MKNKKEELNAMEKEYFYDEGDNSSPLFSQKAYLTSKLECKGESYRKNYFPLEFHVSKKVRDFYKFDNSLFTLTGNVVLSNFNAVRLFAKKLNERRDLKNHPEKTIKAGQLNAMGLIDEILHYVIGVYRQQKNTESFKNALKWIGEHLSSDVTNKTLLRFVELFPPLIVYQEKISTEEYMKSKTEDVPNVEIACEEMLLLSLANNNPAFMVFNELFDDSELDRDVSYEPFIGSINDFFTTQPVFGPNNQVLIDLLKAPVVAAPNSLTGQLEYIKDNWGIIISEELMKRILLALDLIKEEEKFSFLGPGLGGPGPSLVPSFKGYEYEELEKFSEDLDWMPRVVLIAKNIYVWMDQLSKKYKRSITKLDQIPDEELDILASWGFSGLWLIGLWERSSASQTIKQICGNPEAVASAYSLYDYVIANDLGGEGALENLKSKAWQRGIRLSSDMVPNHVGIYSKWVIEHPDWFIQSDYPPFPSYNFSGQNLSWDSRVGIYIEDGYWDRRDAAVVFKRVDHWTGDVKYIYHGNDGTSMPWNDTAQLNFLREDVREAVIQTILHVAREFPIIRFDAAMTLTKKHYQRLWFPLPGTGGDIPSRAGSGMSREEYDKLFPKEFWREVVDRIAKEVPDTLLLAEAFWLMEGYFVRTLGMHRVYNSAFMNMLKMEENANYRSVIKKVIEFDPEILKRFVNFMNNPDEQTAIAQFGKGDKYFGIVTMMVTMPGLPMFGHGQIEGFTEKYGMEYRKAYWNEEIDWDLVHRHEAEVFPLMKKRHLFSGVKNFVLYDFYSEYGWVNEDVFAYSNKASDEKALIIYNNRYATTRGWIHNSAAMSVEGENPGERKLIQKTLAEGLGIKTDSHHYYIFRDHKIGLEYIRQGREIAEKGLYVELEAYQYHVFLGFNEVFDDHSGYYNRLTNMLNGCGVPSMEEAYKEMYLEPILTAFKQVMNKNMLKKLADIGGEMSKAAPLDIKKELDIFKQNMQNLLSKIKEYVNGKGSEEKTTNETTSLLMAALRIKKLNGDLEKINLEEYKQAVKYLKSYLSVDDDKLPFWRILLSWIIVQGLGKAKREINYKQQSAEWIDEWLLGKMIVQTFKEMGCNEQVAKKEVQLLKILTIYHNWFDFSLNRVDFLGITNILNEYIVGAYLNFNWNEDTLWLSKESLEELMYWLYVTSAVNIVDDFCDNKEKMTLSIVNLHKVVIKIMQNAEKSGYRVKEMLKMLEVESKK
ncbi:MAG: alpha-amylase family glycosyl hydrolase [bacterium]|nr:alpha-amylase family glycosyl hydrolase [bacterium]